MTCIVSLILLSDVNLDASKKHNKLFFEAYKLLWNFFHPVPIKDPDPHKGDADQHH